MAVDYKELARKRAEQRKQSVWYKLAEGENTFRMLPTPAGTESQPIWFEYAIHREVGPKKVQVRCGKDIEGEGDCWLCDIKIPKLQDAGNDARAHALEAREVFMVQAAKYDVDDEKFTGPFLMTPSKTIGDSLLKLIGSKKRDYTSASKGLNVSISRTGTGKNDTKYGAVEIDEEPTQVPAEIIKKLKPFDQLKEIPVYSEGAQKAAYQGIDYVEAEDADEDEAPVRRIKKAAPVEDEPEVDDAEDDVTDDSVEDLEEEIAPPKKKKAAVVEDDDEPAPAKKKKAAVVEDDDEPEPAPKKNKQAVVEDDDEPEPAPAKKKKAAPADDEIDDLTLEDLDDVDLPPAKPKKKAAVVEDDDEPAPAKKKKAAVVEDDDDEPAPAPKKKKAAVVEDDEDELPPKKKARR